MNRYLLGRAGGGGGIILRWTSIPSRGSGITLTTDANATETGTTSGLMGHLDRMQTVFYSHFLSTCYVVVLIFVFLWFDYRRAVKILLPRKTSVGQTI